MDVLLLSRLQFAMATMFHFIFVPLTLGLSIIVALMEWKYVKTNDEMYKRMAKFWGKLFVINFVLGVVTGITLEFQFGTNWSRYSSYVGDIFGSLLAIEATAAFFLESTFMGAWVFGWQKLSPKAHAWCITLVAFASNLSALWILIANAFMQHPVGYVIRNGRAELNDFWAVISNHFAWQQYAHTLSAAFALAGFFVMGVSAYHLLRKKEIPFFTSSFKYGATFAILFSLAVAGQGHFHAQSVAKIQPAKLAAMESHWDTQKNAPMYLLTVPSQNGNLIEAIKIPGALSMLATNSFQGEVKGLNDFPQNERPPVLITFLGFRIMVMLGTLMILLAAWAFLKRNKPVENKLLLRVLLFAIPIPYLAIEAGWVVAEVGRQPWIVHGLMKTADAVSPVSSSYVAFSLVYLTLLYIFLGAVDIFLLIKYARKGPEPATTTEIA